MTAGNLLAKAALVFGLAAPMANAVECTAASYDEPPSSIYPMGRTCDCSAWYVWNPVYGWVPIGGEWNCYV